MNQLIYERISRKPQQFVKVLYFDDTNDPQHVPKHWHRSIEIIFPIHGYVRIWVDGEYQSVKAGEFFLINSQSIHACYQGSRDYRGYAIQIDLNFIKIVYPRIETTMFINEYLEPLKENAIAILNKMIAVKDTAIAEIEINGYATVLISKLLSGKVEEVDAFDLKNNQHAQLVSEIMNYIDKNYTEKLSSNEIAKKYNLSYGYLARIFKDTTGMTLTKYISYQRLENAIDDLRFSTLTITQIALKNGFCDYKSFDKSFKQKFKMKPSEYKEKLQQG